MGKSVIVRLKQITGVVLTAAMTGLIAEYSCLSAAEEERLEAEIRHHADEFVLRIDGKLNADRQDASGMLKFQSLVRTEKWVETWPDGKGGVEKREVTGGIWNEAIQAALRETNRAVLPRRDKPYYLDAPIVLRSGQILVADRETEIRLKPGVNTCMIRNENIVGGQNGPLSKSLQPDTDIAIEGGIWTTLAVTRRENNGNSHGRADRNNTVPCCHGVILLSNVRSVAVRKVVIRQSRPFGVHLSNCSDFLVEDVTFEDHGRDGVHVNGPASFGIIRNITGVTHDDFVALNAWDWRNCTPTFGPIHHMLVENVAGSKSASQGAPNPLPDGTAEIRLLPGTKNFADGSRLACDIRDCVFRKLTDIRTVKIYDQPNLELGRDKDFADPIGVVNNIHFRQLVFNRPGRFQIAADVDGLTIDDVKLGFAVDESFRLVEVGPMSATYKSKPDDPSTWVEIFSPDKNITLRNLHLNNVQMRFGEKIAPLLNPEDRLVKVFSQTLNSNYPKTTPRGGSGKGDWIR